MKNANKINFTMSDKEFQKLLDELPKLLEEFEKEVQRKDNLAMSVFLGTL
jgi:hypothetical protein